MEQEMAQEQKRSKMSKYSKGKLLYEGKGKKVFEVVGEANLILMEFKDDLTAFNAQKKGSFAGKGLVNSRVAKLCFDFLGKNKIKHHSVHAISEREMVCQKCTMIPLEVVIRNRLAGSTAKKFRMEEGTRIDRPLVEFFYKKDEWEDPFVSDDQALLLKAVAQRSELDELRSAALKINDCLLEFFGKAGIELIDFKLEFGRNHSGELLLADEISPDGCRLWDLKTQEKLDKDRFRRDLGQVEEKYNEVLKRLESAWSDL